MCCAEPRTSPQAQVLIRLLSKLSDSNMESKFPETKKPCNGDWRRRRRPTAQKEGGWRGELSSVSKIPGTIGAEAFLTVDRSFRSFKFQINPELLTFFIFFDFLANCAVFLRFSLAEGDFSSFFMPSVTV